MAFNLVLQTNNSDKNHLDKSITDIMTLSGTLKANTSIVDPIILVEADLSSLVTCNYMTIDTFGRKYFINDIISVNNGLVEIHAHVDVLTSFKSQIRSNHAIVTRQAYKWNLYLNDGTLKTYQNPHVITKQFPSGFNTQELVLAIAGS